MKKSYFLLSFILFMGLSNSAFATKLVPSLTIYDLTPEKLQGVEHTDSRGNKITIEIHKPAPGTNNGRLEYYTDLDNPLECIGEPPTEASAEIKYSRILLFGNSKAKPVNSPYIIFRLDKDKTTTIKEIQLLGQASSSNSYNAELIYAFSHKSEAIVSNIISGGDFLSLDDVEDIVGKNTYKPLIFPNDGLCALPTIQLIPNTKAVLLITTVDFAYLGVSDSYFKNQPSIHAIRFMVADDLVSIEEFDEVSAFKLTKKGQTIEVNEPSDIKVYDLSGKLILTDTETQVIEFDGLHKGIYLIEAVSKKTGRIYKEKIIL